MSNFEFPGACYEVMRRDMRDAAAEAAFLASYLPPGGRLLDLACGTGTVLRALAAQGYGGTGVDWSTQFIAYAKNAGDPGVEYVCEDIVHFDTAERYDVVACLFGSLNLVPYAQLPGLLRRIAGWLRPNGYLVLDVAHLLNFIDAYQPVVVTHHRGDGMLITRIARQIVRPHDGTWVNDETLVVREADGTVRMYENTFAQSVLTAPEVRVLLESAGFTIAEEFGGFSKAPPSPLGRGPLVTVARVG